MAPHQASCNPTGDGRAVVIKALTPDELHLAAAILAYGMRDNPLHVWAFGSDPELRQRRLFSFLGHLLRHVQSNGEVLGAYMQAEMIGVLGMIAPGRCRPSLISTLRFAGVIAAGNPPAGACRIYRWLAYWARNDPVDPHWHIGPLAVQPGYRRQGVGRHLMSRCCQYLDELASAAYLETDLAINVAFYESLGFTVTKHELVLGVPNWFMIRPAHYRAD